MSKTPNLGIDLRLSGHVQLQQTVKEGFEKIDAAIGPIGLNMHTSGHVPLQQTIADGFNAVDALFGGSLPSDQAVVTNGDTLEAAGYDVTAHVEDNSITLSISAAPISLSDLTVTLGATGDGTFEYNPGADDPVGSITNEPHTGVTVEVVQYSPLGKALMLYLKLADDVPIDGLKNLKVAVGSTEPSSVTLIHYGRPGMPTQGQAQWMSLTLSDPTEPMSVVFSR